MTTRRRRGDARPVDAGERVARPTVSRIYSRLRLLLRAANSERAATSPSRVPASYRPRSANTSQHLVPKLEAPPAVRYWWAGRRVHAPVSRSWRALLSESPSLRPPAHAGEPSSRPGTTAPSAAPAARPPCPRSWTRGAAPEVEEELRESLAAGRAGPARSRRRCQPVLPLAPCAPLSRDPGTPRARPSCSRPSLPLAVCCSALARSHARLLVASVSPA